MKYAILFFDTEINLGISDKPMSFFNYKTLIFDNGTEALWVYANTHCTWSELISGNDEEELARLSAEKIEEMKDEKYITEHVIPYM